MNKIHTYIYKSKTHPVPVGVLAAVRTEDSNNVFIGWSRCRTSAGDKFNKQFGLEIATQRSIKGSSQVPPHSFDEHITVFADRCKRYFKNCEIHHYAPLP